MESTDKDIPTVVEDDKHVGHKSDRIALLLLSGLDHFQVADQTGYELTYCKAVSNKVTGQLKALGYDNVKSLMASIMLQFISHHKYITQLLLKELTSLEADAKAVSRGTKDYNAIVDRQLAISKQVGENNKQFTDTMKSMGVSTIERSSDIESHTHKSKNNEFVIPDSYAREGLDPEKELDSTILRLNKYRQDVRKSKVPRVKK